MSSVSLILQLFALLEGFDNRLMAPPLLQVFVVSFSKQPPTFFVPSMLFCLLRAGDRKRLLQPKTPCCVCGMHGV